MAVQQMLDKIYSYNKSSNIELIKKAFEKCKEWHGSQVRKSGEPYYTHPYAVAEKIIDMNLDDLTIITALLHDVLEDTNITFYDISCEFSTEVAELVNGVTKLDKLNFQLEQIKQAENFRKLFLALAKDIRILIVKLCDRLHNMQTITYKNRLSIKRIAIETLEIYAPLAERIGMRDMASELQDLSFAAMHQKARNAVIRRIEQMRSKVENRDIISGVISELDLLLKSANINCFIKGREKTPYSIWKKLTKKGMTLEQLIDIIGFRVILDSQEDCYKAFGIIHSTYKAVPNTFADYISLPKANGYKSIHTVVIGPFSQKIEIQIRTKEMDIEAEYGLAAHWSYKQGVLALNNTQDGVRIWITRMFEILKTANSAEEFLETTKLEMYTEQIFAFTPDGDIVNLPHNATVLDFAFAVHSDVGRHFVSAKVNNSDVTPDYKIKNGDQVKIVTSAGAFPTIDWLKMVSTGKAKYEIKRATKEEQIMLIRENGKQILLRLFSRYGYKVDSNIMKKLMLITNIEEEEIFYLKIATNVIDIVSLVKKVYPEMFYVKEAFLDIGSFDGIDDNRDVSTNNVLDFVQCNNICKVKNLEHFVCKLSGCCSPHDGSCCIGIVMPYDAIYIHSHDCVNLTRCYLGRSVVIDGLMVL